MTIDNDHIYKSKDEKHSNNISNKASPKIPSLDLNFTKNKISKLKHSNSFVDSNNDVKSNVKSNKNTSLNKTFV